MRSRVLTASALVLLVTALAAPASAESTKEKIARKQAESKARTACMQAKARGHACAPARATYAVHQTQREAPRRATGGAKRIEISIGEQVLRAYEGRDLVLSTPVSTGTGQYPTPTGRFSIQGKEENHWSKRWSVWMPWAMHVVGGVFIHELPLTRDGRRIGSGSLGNQASHGCIRVGVGDAERLYRWTPVGTPVVIS